MTHRIPYRWQPSLALFEGDYPSLAACVEAAVQQRKALRYADLRAADLRGADLRYADLAGAKMEGAIREGGR